MGLWPSSGEYELEMAGGAVVMGERAAGERALSELERDMLRWELDDERTENVGRLRARLVTVASPSTTGGGSVTGGRVGVARMGELARGEEGKPFGVAAMSRVVGVVDRPRPVVDDLRRFQNGSELLSCEAIDLREGASDVVRAVLAAWRLFDRFSFVPASFSTMGEVSGETSESTEWLLSPRRFSREKRLPKRPPCC